METRLISANCRLWSKGQFPISRTCPPWITLSSVSCRLVEPHLSLLSGVAKFACFDWYFRCVVYRSHLDKIARLETGDA